MPNRDAELHGLFKLLFQAHPWHGVEPAEDVARTINAFIEIAPTDPVKYELDKSSGHLRVDRPQDSLQCVPRFTGSSLRRSAGSESPRLCPTHERQRHSGR